VEISGESFGSSRAHLIAAVRNAENAAALSPLQLASSDEEVTRQYNESINPSERQLALPIAILLACGVSDTVSDAAAKLAEDPVVRRFVSRHRESVVHLQDGTEGSVEQIRFAMLRSILVVYDEKEPPATIRAAAELSSFLSSACGAFIDLRVLKTAHCSDATAQQIAVGPRASVSLGLDPAALASLGCEGVLIAPISNSVLCLTGAHVSAYPAATPTADGLRGSTYAVYVFLERLGFAWLTPSVELAPTLDPDAPLPQSCRVKLRFVPPLLSRDIAVADCFNADWARRNRLNGPCSGPRVSANEAAYDTFTVPHADEQLYGGHLGYSRWPGFEHTLPVLVSAATQFETHPQWFGLIDGHRDAGAQLCFSNVDVLAYVTQRVVMAAELAPRATVISVTQGDGNPFCTCSKCSAIYKAEGAISGAVIRFVNAVATAIAAQFPTRDLQLDTFAYQKTRQPCKTRPLPSLIIRLCAIECNFRLPLSTDVKFAADLAGWKALGACLWTYTYHCDFANYLQPFPDLQTTADNIAWLVKSGVQGCFCEGCYQTQGSYAAELKGYLLSRALWDPAGECSGSRALDRDRFMAGVYGVKVGRMVNDAFQLVEKSAERVRFFLDINAPVTAAYLDPATVLDFTAKLEAAEAAAQTAAQRAAAERCLLSGYYVCLLRFDELKAHGGAWPLKESTALPMFGRFAQLWTAADATHLSENTDKETRSHDLAWLRRQIDAPDEDGWVCVQGR